VTNLRELKKARTRASIRENALRLFREQGYSATTIEQIAEAAEVSPSTFFRYFPTKEDVVVQDDFDLRFFDAFEQQPADMPPLAAARAAIRESLSTLTEDEWVQRCELTALTFTVPEIRARTLDAMARTIEGLTEALARRTGLPYTDPRLRTFAGAVLGVMMSVMMTSDVLTSGHVTPDLFERIEQGLALLEEGLPLTNT
jgi:AcrR family transcriptional regulator